MKRSAADLLAEASAAPDRLAVHRAKAELAAIRAENEALLDRLHLAELRADLAASLREQRPLPIVRRERRSRQHEATAVVLCSDWHVGEEVRPALLNNRNAFDAATARRRVTKLAEGVEWLIRLHREGSASFKIRDLVVCLAGDMVTGWLHQDQVATNTLLPMPEVLLAYDLMGGLLDALLRDVQPEHLRVVCNYGNHARTTYRTLHSAQAETSLEFLAYSLLSRRFAADKRVRFDLCAGKLQYTDIYEFVMRSSHGDDVGYQGGIGGITIPIYKAVRSWNTHQHADIDVMGHWHQYISLPSLVVNGSLIGANAYSLAIKAPYEPPAQAFFLVEPGRGKRADNRVWLEPTAKAPER